MSRVSIIVRDGWSWRGRFPAFAGAMEILDEARWGRRSGSSAATPSTSRCAKVADLKGGYGTSWTDVVFALPLTGIGLERGGRLSLPEALTATGSFSQERPSSSIKCASTESS